jgi:hypothetical protein
LHTAILRLVTSAAGNDAPATHGTGGFNSRQNVLVYGSKFGCHACRVSGSSASGLALLMREMDHSVLGDVPDSSIQQSQLLNDFGFFGILTTRCVCRCLRVCAIPTLQYGQFGTLCANKPRAISIGVYPGP